MKYAAFKLAGSHCLFLWHGRLPSCALCVAADPVPHAEILN